MQNVPSKPKILFTKSLSKSQQASPAAMGLQITEQPFIKITYTYDTVELPTADAWVITSANAANYISTHFDEFPKNTIPDVIYAISPRSAELIEPLDLNIEYAGTDAESLARHIVGTGNIHDAVFFCGNRRRDALPRILTAAGIKLTEREVYKTKILKTVVNMEPFQGIAFASPSAVEGFAELNNLTNQEVFVIGGTTAAAAERLLGAEPIMASEPSIEELLKTIYYHYK